MSKGLITFFLLVPTKLNAVTNSTTTTLVNVNNNRKLCFCSENLVAVCLDDGTIYLNNRITVEKQRLAGSNVSVSVIAFNKKDILASGYSNGTIKLRNATSGELLNQFDAHDCAIECLHFLSDNLLISKSCNHRSNDISFNSKIKFNRF